MTAIIAKNQTGTAIFLPRVNVEIPASPGAVTLTDFAAVFEIQSDSVLLARILAGDIILNDGTQDLSTAQSTQFASVVTAGSPSDSFVTGLRETGGPTVLAVAAVADGQFLRRSGSTIIGGTAGSGGSVDWKDSVRAGTTANITLSGTQTIDGVSVVASDRVLVKNQTIGSENGIYVCAAGAWSRSTDADTDAEVTSGLTVRVEEGTTFGASAWTLTTVNPIVVGTTSLVFAPLQLTTATSPANVTKAAAVIGTDARAAHADHKHDVSTAAAGTIAVGDAAAEGTATSLARSDHLHALPAPAAPADVTKAAASAGAATTVARADHKHDVSTTAPSTQTHQATNTEGTATSLARSDHVHAFTAPTAPADVTKAAASAGSSTNFARQDHKHDVTTAAPAATGVSTASADGTATTLARSDHAHQSNTAPVNVTKAAAAIGTSGEPARADHKHDVTTAAPTATGVATASADGAATTLARSDHAHQSNTAPVNVTKAAAAIGTSGEPARADHKHDVTTAAPAIGIGGGNSEGAATSLARSDHDHALRTTTGPTDLTIGAVADGQFLQRSGTTIVGGTPAGSSTTFKTVVRVATTTNGALATAYENGDTIDGVTLATGDRILIKNQTIGSENGIYTVNASGAPTRSTDMAAASSASGVYTFVQQGTANADTAWLCTTDAPNDVVGTDSLTFAKRAFPLTSTAPADVTKAAAAVGTSEEAARADHKHDVSTAAPGATGVSTASGEGSATSLARSDHTHQSNTAPVNVTRAAAAIGTSGEPARADHKHDVTTAAPAATGVATASAEGTATTLARSDHAHQSNTAPVNVTKAAASIGTSGEPARADHKHDVTTAAPAQGIGGGSAEGSATSLARSDHDHAVRETGGPTNLTVASIADGQYVKRSGTTLAGVGPPWPFGGTGVTPRVWTVHPTDTDADHSTIQAAITAASTGDIILIGIGTYSEALTVSSKFITLVGLAGGSGTDQGVRVDRATGASATCLTVTGTGVVHCYNISFTMSHSTGAVTLKGVTLGGSGGLCQFVHCSIIITIVAPSGSVTAKGIDSAGSTQSAEMHDCVIKVLDTIDSNTPSLMGIDISTAASYTLFDSTVYVDYAGGGGTAEGVHVAPGAGNGLYLTGGFVDGINAVSINRVSGFVVVRGASVTGGVTGDTDTDTETNIIKDVYGMVRTDGRQNTYKLPLRSLTSDPGAITNGDVWYRSDLTPDELRARIDGSTQTVATRDIGNYKQPVRIATTANITLSGTQTIDSVGVVAGDRVLVKNQATASENGIYVCAAGAWSRATDADVSVDVTSGLTVFVSEGTIQAVTVWSLSTPNPITLGSTSLAFTQIAPSTAGGAPVGAQYVALATDGTLTQERVLTAGKNLSLTDAGAGGTVTLAESATSRIIGSTLTPTAPGADQNDYNPTNWDGAEPNKATILRVAPTTSIQITGLAGGVSGRIAILQNTSTDALILLADESAASTAANRFAFRNPVFLMPGMSIQLIYDSTASRWRSTATSAYAAQFDSYDDFYAAAGVFGVISSGTAASSQTSTYLVNTTEKPLGTIQSDTGTTATGRSFVGSSSSNSIVPAQGPALFVCRIAVETLSTVGEEFQIFAGFHDAASGTNTTDGVYWAYRRTSSVNWMRCVAAASTRTETAGSVAVDTNYVWLGIFINAAWTRADYFISTDSVTWTFAGSISSGLPSSAQLVQIGVGINKTAGTTQRNMYTDLLGIRYDMTRG